MLPELMLLGFAAWTLVLLLTTVGAYRLSRVFSGRAGMSEFRADQVEGQDWYRRAMRAHATRSMYRWRAPRRTRRSACRAYCR